MLLSLALLAAASWEPVTQEGMRLYRQGRFVEAEQQLRQAADLAASFDAADPRIARSWNNLAAARHALARYADAESAYRRALDWWDAHGRTGDIQRTTLLNNLASLLRLTGRYAEAEELCASAVAATDEKIHSSEEANFLYNLAEILRARGSLARAEQAVHAGLALIPDRRSGPGAHLLQSLALLRLEQHDLAGAEEFQRQANGIFEAGLEPDHPTVASAVSNLGQILIARGDVDAARPLLDRALAIWERSLGPAHPNVAVALNNLSQWHLRKQELLAAEPLLRRAVGIWEKAYGTNHPDVAKGLYNLGALFQAQGKLKGAESLYRRALAASEGAGGSPQLARSILLSLAQLLEAQNRVTEAAKTRGRLGFAAAVP